MASASDIQALESVLHPLPAGATEQAQSAHAMWMLFGITGFFVAVLVIGLIFWCLFRYRSRSGDDGTFPLQFRRNNRMEILYTVLPMILVGILFFYTYNAERRIETISLHPDLTVNVSAFRWSWRFLYPAYNFAINGATSAPPQLVLPLNETVRFNVSSLDVDHSFWIPAFLFKRDAIPGLRNVFDIKPTKLGIFRGECGEFCGLHHALMLFSVRVVTAREFVAWTDRQRHFPETTSGASP